MPNAIDWPFKVIKCWFAVQRARLVPHCGRKPFNVRIEIIRRLKLQCASRSGKIAKLLAHVDVFINARFQ